MMSVWFWFARKGVVPHRTRRTLHVWNFSKKKGIREGRHACAVNDAAAPATYWSILE